ncbi:uncharacterized protein LOC125625805 isoform X3 [Caretta caretta]|uniref:uncharacterized protein LOC125625805 isoform X3 n=1 Tax=Caretta caretta TaxID=8467 RepID=UPI0020957AB8|nr:uncharacterized protein LOC125625805 isoform X3 [Caretta caretta]
MAPKERSVWWVWISVLCAGTVARAAEQRQSSKDTGQIGHLGGTASYFTWTAERTDRNATWIATNTATSAEGGPTTPNTTVLIPVKDTTGHKTTGQLSKPEIAIHSVEGICNVTLTCTMREGGGDITYVWHQPGKSHVLSTEPILRITQKPPDGFLNYTCTIHNTESKSSSMVSLSKHCDDSRSRAGSSSQSSDSDSQDNQAVHSAAHVNPHPEAWNRTGEETPTTKKNEEALADPDPSPQPEHSTASPS